MPSWERESINRGEVTSRSSFDLQDGEVVRATGLYYVEGDQVSLARITGRIRYLDLLTSKPVTEVHAGFYDVGDGQMIAVSDGDLYGGTIIKDVFAQLVSFDIKATALGRATYNDVWYYATGENLRGFKTFAPLAVQSWGMRSPTVNPTVTARFDNEIPRRPTVAVAVPPEPQPPGTPPLSLRLDEAFDSSSDTNAFVGSSLTPTQVTWSGFPTAAANTRQLSIVFNVKSPENADLATTVRTDVYISEDGGVTFGRSPGNPDFTWTGNREDYLGRNDPLTFTVTGDPADVQVRFEVLGANSIDQIPIFIPPSTNPVGTIDVPTYIMNADVYDIVIGTAGADPIGFLTSQAGIKYGFTEYDANSNKEGPVISWQGEGAGAFTGIIETTVRFNVADIDLTNMIANLSNPARTTHIRIYRAPNIAEDAANNVEAVDFPVPVTFGRIATVSIAEPLWTDEFLTNPDDQAVPLYPMILVSAGGGDAFFDRDTPPPGMNDLAAFQASLVGILGRALRYSVEDTPESWPEVYVINSFPLEENDTLVALRQVGGKLIVGAKGAMFNVQRLPYSTGGIFTAGIAREITGAPGVVGRKALAVYGVSGESNAAWISETGVYITNGFTYDLISEDMDWSKFAGLEKSEWSLEWDAARKVLIFSYSTSFTDDGFGNQVPADWRYAFFHMDQTHLKQNGRPKVTSGHFGRIYSIDSAPFSGKRRMYSGDDLGVVYEEDIGYEDASEAFAPGSKDMAMFLTMRKFRQKGRRLSLLKAQVECFDVGKKDIIVKTSFGEDESGLVGVESQIISPSDIPAFRQFTIMDNADWMQLEFSQAGQTELKIGRVEIYVHALRGQGLIV